MRQAIVTKYSAPTNSKGSRVRVSAQAGTRFYTWDPELGSDENHAAAARAFAKAFDWRGRLVGGGLPDGSGYVFVFDEDQVPGPLGRPKSIDEERVRRLKTEGLSNRGIAAELGVSHGAINSIVSKLGL